MRPWSDAEEVRLIAIYEKRARAHRIAFTDVREIGFALQRPPQDVIAEILALQARGRIAAGERPHELGRRPRLRRQVTGQRFARNADRRGAFKYAAVR